MIFTSFSITPYSVNHMLEALNISKHILRRPNQIYSSSIYWYLNTLCGLNKLPIKYLSLQEAFFFRIKQHSQQKCNLQHKACRILYKVIVAFSYFTSILIHAIALQSPYFKFHLAISPPFLSFHLSIPTIPTNTPFLYTSAIFCFPIFT